MVVLKVLLMADTMDAASVAAETVEMMDSYLANMMAATAR